MPAFTTVAAGIGLAATAAGTGMSVGQMLKQNRLMAQADAEAARYLADAKKGLEKNYMASLAIPKLGYENARRELGAQYSQAIEAGREGEARGLGATVGRVAAAATNAQNQITQAQEKELYDLNLATAAEDSRLRDINASLDLMSSQGAQQAASDAAALKAQSMQSIASGIGAMSSQVAAMPKLYSSKSGRMVNRELDAVNEGLGINSEQYQKNLTSFLSDEAGKDYRNLFPGSTQTQYVNMNPVDVFTPYTGYSSTVAENMMTPDQFKSHLTQLTPDQLTSLFSAFQSSQFYQP